MSKPILYKPVTVLEATDFAFTMQLEVSISTYDNILCAVYADDNSEKIIAKLSLAEAEGFTVGITSVDDTTVLITIPGEDLTEVPYSFYSCEIACLQDDEKKIDFIVEKLFEVKPSKI